MCEWVRMILGTVTHLPWTACVRALALSLLCEHSQVVLDIGGQFYCQCFTHPVPVNKQSFYHFCKTEEKIDGCMRKFGAC